MLGSTIITALSVLHFMSVLSKILKSQRQCRTGGSHCHRQEEFTMRSTGHLVSIFFRPKWKHHDYFCSRNAVAKPVNVHDIDNGDYGLYERVMLTASGEILPNVDPLQLAYTWC